MAGVPKYIRNYIRRTVTNYLGNVCTLQEEQTTRGDFGQNDTAWATVAADLPCRLVEAGQNTTEEVAVFAGQDAIDEVKRLIVPHDTGLDAGQRVLLNGETWYVAAIESQMTDEAYRAAIVVKRSGADA